MPESHQPLPIPDAIALTCRRGALLGRNRLPFLSLALALLITPGLAVDELSPLVVTATRAPAPAAQLPVTVEVIRGDSFQRGPAFVVDDALKASAAFSLFRRTNSLMAHPTAQGVSLRNLGPSGAGRTLVLLDGVPLNDPFGGWVTWTKIPRLTLSGAEIVRGGGSSAWGSAALGGTLQFLSAPLELAPDHAAAGRHRTQLLAEVGEASTGSAEFLSETRGDQHGLQVSGRVFRTDGFWRVPAADRGSIDRRTDGEHQVAQLSWQHASTTGRDSRLTARWYRDERGNGTPYQRNRTREAFVGGQTAGPLANGHWAATAYLQSQTFASRFSSVSPDRSSETPALDQYDVPATAAGAGFTATWRNGDTATTTAGLDHRWVEGETREAFFLQEGAFARRRLAGGQQHFTGLFVQHDQALSSVWRAHLGTRVDYWQNRAGRRREFVAATRESLRDERFASRDGFEWSPSAGLVGQVHESVRLRAAVYRAFRVPTLNELYRPFRVGNVITEANPALAVESLVGFEAGADIAIVGGTVSLTLFQNDLEDAVANVTLGAGPGTIPEVGFVPAGGLGRQRRNLDAIRVRGLEASFRRALGQQLTGRLELLLSDATVRRAKGPASGLQGNRLAQVPRATATAGLDWRPAERWSITSQLRHVSRAFEDDANRWRLGAATIVDVRLGYTLGRTRAGEAFVSVENLFDQTVEAGRDADGRIDLGQPRFVHGGIRWQW